MALDQSDNHEKGAGEGAEIFFCPASNIICITRSLAFRWYDESNGERKYRKTVIGTVDLLPTRHDAEGAILAFRRNINSEHRVPETVTDLIAHYRKHELVPERKAFATIQANGIYLRLHVETNWGSKRLQDVRTVDIEKWLYSLNYAPGNRFHSTRPSRRRLPYGGQRRPTQRRPTSCFPQYG